MVEWETIRLPTELAQKVDNFLKTDFAKEFGYTSRSQVVVNSVRDFLAVNRKFTFFLNHPKYGKLKFHKKGPLIFCAQHNKVNCKEVTELYRHSKSFDFDLLDDGDILSGVDFDRKIDIKNPQRI